MKNLFLFRGAPPVLVTLCFSCGAALAQSNSPAFYYSGGGGADDGAAMSVGNQSGCVAATTTPAVSASLLQYFGSCSIGSSMSQNQSFTASAGPGAVVATGTAAEAGAVSASSGVTLSSSVSNNSFNLDNDPPFGEFSSSEAIYYQAGFTAAPGSIVTRSYQVNSNIDNRGSFSMVSITLASQQGTDFNYGSAGIPPTTIATGAQTQTLTTTPLTIGDSGTYSITIFVQTVINNGAGSESISVGGCSISAFATGNGTPTMGALATAPPGLTLSVLAPSCGFIGFNWTQVVTEVPCPTPYGPAVPSMVPNNVCPPGSPTPGTIFAGFSGLLSIPLLSGPPFTDPPPGGYSYLKNLDGSYYDSSPYYIPPEYATTPNQTLQLNDGGEITSVTPNRNDRNLVFVDSPTDVCLPTVPATFAALNTLSAGRAVYCNPNLFLRPRSEAIWPSPHLSWE